MPASVQLPPELTDQLLHWFDEESVVTPSISYALFDRTGVLFSHGTGEFQRDGRAPELETVYRICSMSKSFLTACVLVLADRGELGLEDPVSRWVPEFPTPADQHGVPLPVTVRMLMSNCSGLPEDNAWADHHLGISRDELLDVLRGGLNWSELPDTSYQYSNLAFAVLGLIVENVTGQPFAEFATTTLLEPLGLTGTRYDWHDYPDDGEGGAGIAHGFESFDSGATWFERPFVATGAFGCAGSMFSTLVDIARWSAWLSSAFDPANGDDTVLSRASRRRMQRILTPVHSAEARMARPDGDNIGYGLGLVVEQDARFGSFAQHSGGLPGFSTNMRWHCSSGLGVVVFTNTNGLTPALWAARMLRTVLLALDAPARDVTLWPATAEAAAAVDAVVRGPGHLAALESLYSPNVLVDVPPEVRDARLAAAVAEVGGLAGDVPPLADRLAWSVSAAHLCWTVPGRNGELELRIEMTETEPSVVQRLDVAVRRDDPGAAPLVVHHQRPVLPAPRGA